MIKYETLRQWQLARLRNLASEQAAQAMVTPARLIASDRELIRQLASAAAATESKLPPTKFFPLHYLLVAWLTCQVLMLFACILTVGSQGLHAWLEATIMAAFSLVPSPSNALSTLAFLTFYFLPVLTLIAIPVQTIRNPPLLLYHSSMLGHISGIMISIIITWWATTSMFGPGEVLSLPTRCLITWTLIAFILMLLSVKCKSAQLILTNQVIGTIIDESDQIPDQTRPADLPTSLNILQLVISEFRQREAAIADFSPTVILSFTEDLCIDAVSPSVLAQWGYFPHQLIGQNLRSIVFIDDFESFGNVLVCGNQPILVESRIRLEDNRIVDIHWYIEWSSQFDRFFAACENVTDRMNLERARHSFIAQLTHDMRAPLAAVNLTLSALKETATADVPSRMIDRSLNGVARVVGLINEILEVEKLSTRTASLQLETFQLGDVCTPILEELHQLASQKNVEFNTIGFDVTVNADKRLLARVLSNLISNAVSFSPKNGAVRITSNKRSVRGGDIVLVQVADQGPGISPDYQKLIFERFGVAGEIKHENRASTGLGLSICREIVSAHSGTIGVESELSAGSTFWFTLPSLSE